jgi:uncharacterized Zn finger protein
MEGSGYENRNQSQHWLRLQIRARLSGYAVVTKNVTSRLTGVNLVIGNEHNLSKRKKVIAMEIYLSEEQIRERASEKSFERGNEYYHYQAIHDPTWEALSVGIALMAYCEGSQGDRYRLRVELERGWVKMVSCTCPYDWGGDCKHIVALLLTYLRQPEVFHERVNLADLLRALEKDELVDLLLRLVRNDPDLYDELTTLATSIYESVSAESEEQTEGEKFEKPEKRPTLVSESIYRKRVKRILKQSRYDDDPWGSSPGFLEDLEEIYQEAVHLLDSGDAEGALTILKILLEETIGDYDEEADYEGDYAGFIQDLGLPMAEGVLSAELDTEERDRLYALMDGLLDDLDPDYIEFSELAVILTALEYGWDQLPDQDEQLDKMEEEEWMLLDDLAQARLNVLERQGSTEKFLQLAEKASPGRYIHKLLDTGQIEAAIMACQRFELNHVSLAVARKLYDVGRVREALELAERGLGYSGNSAYDLTTWLAPLQEKHGKTEAALSAYQTAFGIRPSIEIYRKLKRLSGANWQKERRNVTKKISPQYGSEFWVDIHLEEGEWEAAIALAEKSSWSTLLLEKVAEVLIPHRPDWVISVSTNQAEVLILKTQSNLYPAAAQWLLKARKAYQHKNQMAQWEDYMVNLRSTYARRPALQKAIGDL